MTVRVRIGPSPTGEPHVGTAYISLFNLAFAKKNGGQFVLRIEDTDRERSRQEWEQEIVSGLHWLGLDWDEGPDKGGPYGPYRQSERGAIYQEHASLLLERGHAYRCFCTKARLDELRARQRAEKKDPGYDRHCRNLSKEEVDQQLESKIPYVVRMGMPIEGQTVFTDELRGEVAIDNARIDDQVILKSDGFPTYHLANVVDDHLMKISHVIRAEEWINSTPKHVVLYEMFGWEPPKFFHMPLLRNPDKSKISKRKNPVSLLDYKSRGFIPEAVLNYLAMLGWTMPDEREVFSFDEFVQHFSFDRLSLGGPTFDLEKLTWLNGKYFREKMNEEELTRLVRDTLFTEERIRALIPLARERIDTVEQFIPLTDYFFSGSIELDPQLLKPKKKKNKEGRSFKEVRQILEAYVEAIDRQYDFSPEGLEAFSRSFAERHEWGPGELFMPLRTALTGRTATPPLFDTLSLLGRAKVRRRIRDALEVLKKAAKDEAKQKSAEKKG